MRFDAAVSLRLIHNERLRCAAGWGDYRDLGGALALTSDAPIEDLNCLESFTTNDRHLEGLLDIGFSLLRAFDRAPAVSLTPLDRPKTIARRLRQRGLVAAERSSTMIFRGDVDAPAVNREVDVRIAGSDDVATFAAVHGAGDEKWVKRLSMSSTLAGMLDEGNVFYIGYLDGRAVGTTHLLRDGATAGIYAVGTLKAFRRRGVASALILRAVRDAREAGCDVIGLRTMTRSDAHRLYATLGFEDVHESVLWTVREGSGF